MEISINNTHEASGLSKVCDFTIETNGIMVKALTSRLYSNPIASIVRELASNALDACPTIPMDISLPTYLDPQFSIQDYGPGISPEDMASIFTHFGSSTKRNTNTQIGGFGLGAKSPFAIVNSFTIYSHYRGQCYHYIASIQKDGMPALHLVTTTPSSISGVKIQVPASSDFYKWKEALSQIRFFHPRPNISGCPEFKYPETLHDCSDFFICKGGAAAILVGPVAYPLRESSATTGSAMVPPLALKFGIGELEVTASREEIVYTPEVAAKIRDKFNSSLRQYRVILQELLYKTTTLDEAFALLSGDTPSFPLTWKGGEINHLAWEPPVRLAMVGRLLGGRQKKNKLWHVARPWAQINYISKNVPIFVADVSDKLQARVQNHPQYSPNSPEILIVDCAPSRLDEYGIKYNLLSSVTVPKSSRGIPVRLRAMTSTSRIVSTTENFSHYLQLDSNKCAKINGVVSWYDYSIHRLFKEMLGFDFYVLPYNFKKIPAHISPVEPVILDKLPSELQRHQKVLESYHYTKQLTDQEVKVGKILGALGLISPAPFESFSTAPITHLLDFGLITSPLGPTIPNWRKEITNALTQYPQYEVFSHIFIPSGHIQSVAALISKE